MKEGKKMKLRFWEVAEVVNAQNDWRKYPDFEISSVEFDSRKVGEQSLFIPLKGNRDGHEFIAVAKENGAGATLFSADYKGEKPGDFPYLEVIDPLKSFQKLAQYYLEKINPKVVAITGSNGKTTTKDMTAAVLAQKYQTYKTQGNYNNHIGLPYTILHMPTNTEMLVLEMGMDHQGEIAQLTQLAKPDVATITLIGESHIENFEDRSGIARAKMEIQQGLKEDGLLIIPEDEPLLKPLIKDIPQTVQTFGSSKADFYTTEIQAAQKQTLFKVNQHPNLNFSIPVLGAYNTRNALIALAVGKHFGLELEQIQQGLATMQLTQNRTEWLKAANGAEILSDVYNANPTAMALVLDTFSQLETKGRKLVVLGDMLELGKNSAALHAQMSKHIDPNQIAEIFLYGSEMKNLAEKLKTLYPETAFHYFTVDQREDLLSAITASLQPEDTIMLKASNGMKLAEIVKSLVKSE